MSSSSSFANLRCYAPQKLEDFGGGGGESAICLLPDPQSHAILPYSAGPVRRKNIAAA